MDTAPTRPVLQSGAHRSLLRRVWERLLEIDFLDRSVALAGEAFVSFFPLVIVVAAFVPERTRVSILTAITARLGLRGDALAITRDAFASSDDVRRATGVIGLVMTILFASSFMTALQRVYRRSWRRPPGTGVGLLWRLAVLLLAALAAIALLGALTTALDNGLGAGIFVAVSFAVPSALWWFAAWFLLLGEIRASVLFPTGLITGILTTAYGLSATIWMPDVVISNEDQFGFVGVALALITWFSGAAICVIVGACAGAVLAEDGGSVGSFIRGGGSETLTAGARQPMGSDAQRAA